LALRNFVLYTHCHISNQMLWSSWFKSGLLGAYDIDIHPSTETHYVSKLCLSRLTIVLAKTIICHSKQHDKGSHSSGQNTY